MEKDTSEKTSPRGRDSKTVTDEQYNGETDASFWEQCDDQSKGSEGELNTK